MIKIGDKVLVLAKITQIIESEDGVEYVISPDDKKRSYSYMRVKKEDIKSSLDS